MPTDASDKSQSNTSTSTLTTKLQEWAQIHVHGGDKQSQSPAKTADSAALIAQADTSGKPGGSGANNQTEVANSKGSAVHQIIDGFTLINTSSAADRNSLEVALTKLDKQSKLPNIDAKVLLGSKLLDDPDLLNKVVDAVGKITHERVSQVMSANAGSEIHSHEPGSPVRLLTSAQKEVLDFALMHPSALSGLDINQIGQLKTEDIKKCFAKDGSIDTAKVGEVANRMETTKKHEAPRTTSEGVIPADQFADQSKKVLARIDPEGKGVTKEQLAKALQDPSFKGQDAQVLAAMYFAFDGLHNLSHHEGLFDKSTITAADMDKYKQIETAQQQKSSDAYSMKAWAHANLSKYAHGDTLTHADLEKAINDPKTPDSDKQMLKKIDQHWSDLSEYMGFGGTKVSDFDDYAQKMWNGTADAKVVSNVNWICSRTSLQAQQKGETNSLYATKNPLDSIKASDIKQGTTGDCYFDASLAAVANNQPELIKDMIKDNHDGTYTVTFQGAPNEPITVKAPTEAEMGLYNGGSKDGVWAAVVEKAFGQYKDNHAWLFNSDTPQDEAGAGIGGLKFQAIRLLTGHDTQTSMLSFHSQEEVANRLQAAFSAHPPKVVAAGINKSLTGDDKTSDGLSRDHDYTVEGFIPDGHGGGTVILRNPWGGADGTPDGTFQMPLSEFMKNFSDMTAEQ